MILKWGYFILGALQFVSKLWHRKSRLAELEKEIAELREEVDKIKDQLKCNNNCRSTICQKKKESKS